MIAIGEYGRVIDLTIIGDSLTTEAIRLVGNKITELEDLYALNPDNVPDLTAADVVLTGKAPFKVFAFKVTTVMATATYSFDCLQIVPNVDSITEF